MTFEDCCTDIEIDTICKALHSKLTGTANMAIFVSPPSGCAGQDTERCLVSDSLLNVRLLK